MPFALEDLDSNFEEKSMLAWILDFFQEKKKKKRRHGRLPL